MRAFRIVFAAMFLASFAASNAFGGGVAALSKPEMQRLNWKGRTIKIAISNSLTRQSSNIKIDSDVAGAINRSLQAWQNAANIEFLLETSDKQSLSSPGISGDGVNLITIAQTPENVLLFSRDPDAESAKTRVFYNNKGFITEADIVLNPLQQFSTDGTLGTFDLQTTLTHEIGHLLGLRHSAIMGATMSDRLSMNGMFGLSDLSLRRLTDSDIASVRDLYGGREDDANSCCSVITGKLSLTSGRAAKSMRVWAEENETGRVIGQDETGTEGTFRIGGIPSGTYALFWQKNDARQSMGELGTVAVEAGETLTVDKKIAPRRSSHALRFIGLHSQLTDFAIPVSAGREYTVYLGGTAVDAKKIEFNSPYFSVVSATLIPQDFGDEVSVVSFVLRVSVEARPGVYSVFATGPDGMMAPLIGSLNVQ